MRYQVLLEKKGYIPYAVFQDRSVYKCIDMAVQLSKMARYMYIGSLHGSGRFDIVRVTPENDIDQNILIMNIKLKKSALPDVQNKKESPE